MKRLAKSILVGGVILAGIILLGLSLNVRLQPQQAQAQPGPTPSVMLDSGARSSGRNPSGKLDNPAIQPSKEPRGITPGAVPIGSDFSAADIEQQKKEAETNSLPPCDTLQSDQAENSPDSTPVSCP